MTLPSLQHLLELLDIERPIIQAPMAGVSTPAMAAAVSEAGGLGSIGVGATDAATAGEMIAAVRARSSRSLNVNLFCHQPGRNGCRTRSRMARASAPRVQPGRRGAAQRHPRDLQELPRGRGHARDPARGKAEGRELPFRRAIADRVRALREAGFVLLGSATDLREAQLAAAAGVQAVVAQGYEAGGHRGMFDPDSEDEPARARWP